MVQESMEVKDGKTKNFISSDCCVGTANVVSEPRVRIAIVLGHRLVYYVP